MDAQRYNAEIDANLSSTGRVDKEMWLKLVDAYTYDAASTVGWVEAKLKVLQKRVGSGDALYLFEKASETEACVTTLDGLESWVARNFQGVRIK